MASTGHHEVDDAPAPRTHRSERYEQWRRWRWLLLGGLVAVQLAGVLSSPVRATSEDFFADLAAGHVHSVQAGAFGKYPEAGYRLNPWAEDPGQEDTSPAGVRWIGRFGAVYQADLEFGPPGTTNRLIQPDQLDVMATAAAIAKRAGHDPPAESIQLNPPGTPWLPLVVGASILLVLFLLVKGPEPRRFTRWGWAWIIVFLPAGIGALWYLLREAPWNARTSARWPLPRHATGAHDPIGPPRRRGWLGLIFALAAGQVLAALLTGGLGVATNHHPS
jgi:hypothetical protein